MTKSERHNATQRAFQKRHWPRIREYQRLWALANPDKVAAKRERDRLKRLQNKPQTQLLLPLREDKYTVNRRYIERNRDAINARRRARAKTEPHRFRTYARNYRQRNREASNAADRAKRKRWRETRPSFKILDCLRTRLKHALKRQSAHKSDSITKLLGCSIESFKMHLESRFEPGMSWLNHSPTGWHIDHEVPCALFDLSKPDHVKACFHFSNLQPMWALDNIRKGAKYDKDAIPNASE